MPSQWSTHFYCDSKEEWTYYHHRQPNESKSTPLQVASCSTALNPASPTDKAVLVTEPLSPAMFTPDSQQSTVAYSPPSSGHIDSAQQYPSQDTMSLEDSQFPGTCSFPEVPTLPNMEEQTPVVSMEEETPVVGMEEETPVAEEHPDEAQTEPPQCTVRRVRRPCPIPECKGALFKNMWNHIFQTHKKTGKIHK